MNVSNLLLGKTFQVVSAWTHQPVNLNKSCYYLADSSVNATTYKLLIRLGGYGAIMRILLLCLFD